MSSKTKKPAERKISQLDIDLAEAKKLGMSYAEYSIYRECSNPKAYKEQLKRQRRMDKKAGNIIASNIIGAGSYGSSRAMMAGAAKL